ncbi:MAG: elongation factor G [Chloroflexi bacterium]|nr:elongation factor G [Chloroflexota bacterium]
MKEYPTQAIRNIALVSHSGAGKTILVEGLLYYLGVTTRMGSIQEGNTVSDFEDEEIRRGLSLSTAIIPLEYQDHKLNLLDTPGYTDFIGEVISALWVSEAALVVVDAVSGPAVGTEVAWNYAKKFNIPRMVLINKMDRDTANFTKTLDALRETFEAEFIPVQLPMGVGENFQGVIDLIHMKAFVGPENQEQDIPAEWAEEAEEARAALLETAAMGSEELMEKYLEEENLSPEDVLQGLKLLMQGEGDYVPVFVAAGERRIGLEPLLRAFVALVPAPNERPPIVAEGPNGPETLEIKDDGPLAAYVWKTTADPFVGKITYLKVISGVLRVDSRVWNAQKEAEERIGNLYIMRGKEQIPIKALHAGDIGTVPKLSVTGTGDTLTDKNYPIKLPVPEYPTALYRVAVVPQSQSDSTKLGPTLTRLCEEDMTLSWYQDPSTNQTILQGMGDQHIDVAIRKAKSKFQINLSTEPPKVPYRETITKTGHGKYRHKKQTGGAGQFAEVHMRVEPNPEENYSFTWEVFGGAISSSFQPAIEKGIKNVMKEGILAGYPVVNVKIAVYDGKEHPVDSKPIAFEIAAREAFKLAFRDAGPVLLEPIYNVRIIVPEENMGDVLGDLNTRRARVQGMDTEKGRSIIRAQVPLAEMLRYVTDLRSLTGGRGVFEMEFSHYEQVPPHIQQQIIEERQREREQKK